MMTNGEFVEEVIRTGIEAARNDYADDAERLRGAVAGFEACRGKTVEELSELLGAAARNMARAHLEQVPDYWLHVAYFCEIEWVCNCWSAVLVTSGIPPIVNPTCRAMLHASRIISDHAKKSAV